MQMTVQFVYPRMKMKISESEDDLLWLISEAADGACDWVQFGDGVSIKMWQSSFLCNVKYEISGESRECFLRMEVTNML